MSDKRRLVLDATKLGTFQRCPFKGFLSFVQHLRANQVNERIEGGSLGHNVLERFYTLLKNGMDFDSALQDALEIGRQSYAEMNLEVEDAEWVLDTCANNLNHWKYDGIKVLSVEEAFITPAIYEDDEFALYYEGKIDLIAEFPTLGKSCLDHKFRGRRTDEVILNNQFIGYSFYTGANVVYVNEIGLQKTLKDGDKFRRQPLSYTQAHIERWKKDVIFWGKQIDFYLQNNTFPRIFDPFNCKGCHFRGVCEASNDEAMLRKLKQDFYVGDAWDVSKSLEKSSENES
jgi:hypothetical protein